MVGRRRREAHLVGGVELLAELVVGRALLAGNEPGQTELLAGLLRGGAPAAQRRVLEVLLARGKRLLGHDLSSLVLAKVFLGEATLGPVRGTAPDSSHRSKTDLGLADRLLGDTGRLLRRPADLLGALGRTGDLGGLTGGAALGGTLGCLGDLGGLAGGLAGRSLGGALRGAGDLGGLAARDAFGGTAFDGHLGEDELKVEKM